MAVLAVLMVGGLVSLLAAVCLGAVLLVDGEERLPAGRSGESFSASVAELDTVDELLGRIEPTSSGTQDDLEVVLSIDDLMRDKFLHGFAEMDWYDNWVLAIAHRVVPDKELMGLLDPDEIAGRDQGICNQQAILFQHLASSLGYTVGSVRISLPGLGHFASAVEVDGHWYLFDSDFEPTYDRRDPGVLEALLRKDVGVIADLYGAEAAAGAETGTITLSDVDAYPAARGRRVQQASAVLSWFGGPILLLFGYLLRRTDWSGRVQRHDA